MESDINHSITINLGSPKTDFQSGNFLNALNELVCFYTIGGNDYSISDNEIIDCLKLYTKRIKGNI